MSIPAQSFLFNGCESAQNWIFRSCILRFRLQTNYYSVQTVFGYLDVPGAGKVFDNGIEPPGMNIPNFMSCHWLRAWALRAAPFPLSPKGLQDQSKKAEQSKRQNPAQNFFMPTQFSFVLGVMWVILTATGQSGPQRNSLSEVAFCDFGNGLAMN